MGQNSSDNRGNYDDEDLKAESRLPVYFYEAVKALYIQRKAMEKGLTADAFTELFRGRLKSKELSNFLVALFRAYDRDQNKHLNFREAITMLDTFLCGDKRDRISGIFRMCDSNENNVIEEKELTEFMLTLSCLKEDNETMEERRSWLKELATGIFENFDKNRDGHLTKVEFMEGCLRSQQMLKEIEFVMKVCVGNGF